jgi:hypothetical protein
LEPLAVRIQTRIDIEKPVVEAVDPVGNPVFHKSTAQFLLSTHKLCYRDEKMNLSKYNERSGFLIKGFFLFSSFMLQLSNREAEGYLK